MTKREEQDLLVRIVDRAKMAQRTRRKAKNLGWIKIPDEVLGERIGLMTAARMLKGYATQAMFRNQQRRAA